MSTRPLVVAWFVAMVPALAHATVTFTFEGTGWQVCEIDAVACTGSDWRVSFYVDETVPGGATDNATYWTYSNNLTGGEVEIDGNVYPLDAAATLGTAYFESDNSTWESLRIGPANGPGYAQLMTDLGGLAPGPMFATRGEMSTYVTDGVPGGALRTTPFNGSYLNFLSCDHGTGVGCLNVAGGQTIKLWSTEGTDGPLTGTSNDGEYDGGGGVVTPPAEPVPFLGPLPLLALALGLGGAGASMSRREDEPGV